MTIKSAIRPVIVSNFGPPALACIRSWGAQGFPVGMVCIRAKEEGYPDSKYLTDFITLCPKDVYTDNGIKTIDQFLKKFHANGIFCINENIACWLNNYHKIFSNKIAIWLPSTNTIKDLLSKKKQIEIARKVGFNVLPTYLIDKNLKKDNFILPEHFPLCLRPNDPGTVTLPFKAHLVYSFAELKTFITSFKKIEKPIIAQPFMNLPNLVVHGARTVSGTTIGLQAFMVERKFEGVTLTICPTALNKELSNKCISFTNQFKLTGNYHFEFLIDKITGSTFFLELNSRLGGTTAKVYICGYDEPLLALQAYGVKTSRQQGIKDIIVSNKQALLKYLLFAVKDRLTPLDYPVEPNHLRIVKTIYGLLKYKDDVFMLRDIRGAFALYLGNIRNSFRLHKPTTP